MDKQDIVRKLTSRKFWTAVCSLVANMILAFGGTEDQTVKVTALIMSGAAVIAYIVGEGLADAAAAKQTVVIECQEEEHPPEK